MLDGVSPQSTVFPLHSSPADTPGGFPFLQVANFGKIMRTQIMASL